MEFLVGFVVVLVLLFVVGGFAAFALIGHQGRTRRRAEAAAPAVLDSAFDGRPVVVFKVNAETPSFETVVVGARERGYRLESQTDDVASGAAKTLIFERA